MKIQLLAAVALLALAIPASASHSDLRSLTHDLDAALAEGKVDAASEIRIREHLEDALGLARNGSPVDGRCLDAALPLHEKAYRASDAIQLAGKLCRSGVDPDVLRVALDAYADAFRATDAISLAGAMARRDDLRGKGDILLVATKKHAAIYRAQDAPRLAADYTAKLPRGSASCVERSLVTYEKAYRKSDALLLAARLCGGG